MQYLSLFLTIYAAKLVQPVYVEQSNSVTLIETEIPQTQQLSAFDISREKGALTDYYSKSIVKNTITRFCRNRYVRLR